MSKSIRIKDETIPYDELPFKVGDRVRLVPKTKEQLALEGVEPLLVETLFSIDAFSREFTIKYIDKDFYSGNIQYNFEEALLGATEDELIPSGAYAKYLKLKGLYAKVS